MGQTLAKSGLFPPLLIEMIKVGERSGELERMLERVADNYEREVRTRSRQMTTLLEPLMTLVMAGCYRFHDAGGADADLPAEPADAMNQGPEVIAMKSRRYNQEGFTLIEIMVVILIIGLLAMIVVQNFRGVTNKAKRTKAQADIAAFKTAAGPLLPRQRLLSDHRSGLAGTGHRADHRPHAGQLFVRRLYPKPAERSVGHPVFLSKRRKYLHA